MTDTEESNTVERELSTIEIEQRKTLHLELETERDGNVAEVADMRSQIRALNLARKRLELRTAQLRREIHSRTVREPRPSPQLGLALETYPEHDAYLAFDAQWPMARDANNLHGQLGVVLQGVATPSIEALGKWDPSTGIFDAIANWARVEMGYMNAKEYPHIVLPPREAMPVALFELRAPVLAAIERAERKPRKPREVRGARPLSNPPASASKPAAGKPSKPPRPPGGARKKAAARKGAK